jgi:LPXTG-motif cell wall-anchored protein
VVSDAVELGSPASSSPSASASASAGPSASANSGAGGGLPVTGANVSTLAIGGLVIVGVGAGLFFAARRRRVRTEA